jgi:uncharacterized protein
MTQQVSAVSKPVPEPDEYSRGFFDGAVRGELMLQRCNDCSYFMGPGARVCTRCLSESLDWVPVSGRGILHSFGIIHQKYHPGFHAEIPYNVAMVELAEGPRIQSNIVGIANEELRVGMPLVATFERVSDDVALPKFRPT